MGRNRNYWMEHNPVADYEMVRRYGHRITLCRLFKEIYKETDNKEIRLKCKIGVSMARSICNRLTMYEGTRWGKIQYPSWNPIYEELKKNDNS